MGQGKRARVALAVGGALVALVLLLLGVVHLPVARQAVLNQFKLFAEGAGFELVATNLDYNLLTGHISLQDIVVRAKDVVDTTPVFRADRLELKLSLPALLGKRLSIEEGLLVHPQIAAIYLANGESNFPVDADDQATPDELQGEPLSWTIRQFSVQQGSLIFEDRDLPAAVNLPNWSLDLTEGSSGDTQLTLETNEQGSINWKGSTASIGALAIRGTLSGNDVDLADIELQLPSLDAIGTGSISYGGSPTELSAAFELDIGAVRLAQFFEIEQDIEGPLALRIHASGSNEGISLTAGVRSESFRYRSLDGMTLNVEAGWTAGADILDLPKAELRSDFGEIDASGRIAIDEDATSFIHATVRGLQLNRLTREFESPVIAAGAAAGDVELSWQGTAAEQIVSSLTGSANLQLAPTLKTPRQNTLPLSGALHLQASSGEKIVLFESLSTLGTSWNGTIRADAQDNLSGEITGASTDAGASYSDLLKFLGEPINLSAPRVAGRLKATFDLNGTLERPRLNAALTGEDLAAGEIRGANLDLLADYANDEISIKNVSLSWAEQSAALQGRVNLSGSSPVVAIELQANQLDIATVRSALGNPIPIDGVLDLQGSVGGTLDTPSGQVTVAGAELVAYGQPFGALTAELSLSEGVARLDFLRLDQSAVMDTEGEIRASGEYHLESEVYSLSTEGRAISLEQLQVAEQEPLGGSLNFNLASSGTIAEPQLKGDANLVEANYQGRELGNLQLHFSAQNGLAGVMAQADKFNASLNAEVGLVSPYPGTLQLSLNNTDLGQLNLRGFKDTPIVGAITATLSAEGEIDRWQDATARLTINETSVEALEGLVVRTNGEVLMRYEERTLIADQVGISAGASALEIGGRLPLEQHSSGSEFTLRGDLDLNEIASFVPAETPIEASGRVELEATISGSLTAPVPQGEVRLLEISIANEALLSPLTSMNGTIRFVDDTVELRDLTGDWAGASLNLNGAVPLALFDIVEAEDNPRPFRIAWSLNGLDIHTLAGLPKDSGGTVSMSGHLEGVRPELEALEGLVEISEMNLLYGGVSVSQKHPSRLQLAKGALTIESFELQGPNLQASLTGQVHLQPEPTLDLNLSADANAAVLALAVDELSAAGPISLRIAARGAVADPEVSGELTWTRGEIASSTAGLAAQNLDLQFSLNPGLISIERLTGTLNGGALLASGTVSYEATEIRDVNLNVKADGVFLEIPEGLRTVSNADLNIKNQGENIVIGGRVEVEEGIYREQLAIDVLLADLLRGSGGATEFVTEPNALLARTRFNIEVESLNPIVVDNNVAKLGAALDVRLTGSYYRPGLIGRIELEEGGELYISENRYFVDRGVIDFLNEGRIQPTLDILARTQVRNNYDIELAITGGGIERVETRLSSSSHEDLGEPDLISLLLTGRLREDLRGDEVSVAAEQSLSYLTGRIGGRLSRAAEESLGLSEVRIEPNLIAAESNPGARLTVGQNVSPRLSLVYSTNLADSSDQIWTVRYDVTRRFQARGVRQAEGAYRMDFQHDVRFGSGQGSARPRRNVREERVIGTVAITGEHPLTEEEVRSKLNIKPGQRYDFFAINQGARKIEEALEKQGRLEAKVSIERELKEATADLQVNVDAGPKLQLIYEGWSPSGRLEKQVRRAWSDGVFDAQRLDDARRLILTELTSRGYLNAEMRSEVSFPVEREKRVLLEIHPNTRFKNIELVFEGAGALPGKQLRRQLKAEGLLDGIYVQPGDALDFIANLYRAEGYLDIQVEAPRRELNDAGSSARLVVPIKEGLQYHVSELAFDGNQALTETQLRFASNLSTGAVYNPALLQDLFLRLEEEYWRAGYQDVELEFQMEKSESEPTIRIVAHINENRQSVVERIQVTGAKTTSEKLALSQLGIELGEPLNFEQSSRGRRALYDTGAYTLVDLSYDPIEGLQSGNIKPLAANLKLREVQPYQIRYGGFFDTDHGPGGILDLRNRNTFGAARTIGMRLRADQEFKEGRIFFSQPLLRSFPLATNVVAFVSQEKRAGEFFDEIDDRRGFSISQESRWQRRYILSYGYRFEKLVSSQDPPDPFFPDPIRLTVAPFTVSFTRETRDDILDASRGDFLSSAFEWAPTQLGGERSLNFVRYFGQYFRYFPLSDPVEAPYQRGVRRSRWVYATGARIGLSRGLGGQTIPRAEKFFAGGGTTLRGFEDDTLGGTDFFGDPIGGNAVFLLNNELRFPIHGMFDGVAFADIGNLYERVRDFNLADLRESAGFGLRVRTPFFLLRADYGIKLDRRPGESAGQFFFSIGQAF